MKEIVLQFPSLVSLIDFAISADGENCHMNLLRLTLSCCLETKDIELALNHFGATVLELGGLESPGSAGGLTC